jgi:hydroxymethylglutaryl-CoA reductase (NADPH)
MDTDKYLKLLNTGKIKPYELDTIIFKDMNNDDDSAWQDACRLASETRLKWVEQITNRQYPLLQKMYCQTELPGKRISGIENKIGGAFTPLGFAGPLKINGEFAKGDFIIPLATNEAALIAGCNRGVAAINMGGGATTIITRNMMTRAPVVEAESIGKANELVRKIPVLLPELKKSVEEKSKYTRLTDIKPYQMGRFVWLRCMFRTGNAMGMNSATKHSAEIIKKIQEKFDVKLIALSGNLCTDKKSTHINVLEGRGKSVECEVTLSSGVIKKIWNSTAQAIDKVNKIKNWYGSGLAGTFAGFNSNAANTVAAFFIATGQDPAEITESCSCFDVTTLVHEKDGSTGLRFNITMPSVEVGAIGGGMYFGTAKECLAMLGATDNDATGSSNACKVAEILAAAVCAQEINLLGTLANNFELAESHLSLARGVHK